MFRPFLPCGIAYGFAYALPMALPMLCLCFAYGFAYGIPCSFSGGRHPAGLFVLYHIGAVLVNRFRQNFGGICLFPVPGAPPCRGGLLRRCRLGGRWRRPTGLNPSGTCSPCPGGEDHLKRRSSSPPVPPLLGCRHCSRESLSVGFTPYRRLPRRKEDCMAGFISAASGSVQGWRGGRPPRQQPCFSPHPAGRGGWVFCCWGA